MANVMKMLLPLLVYADNKHFSKNSRFFTISFNQANDVYVKIYETAQLTKFYVFLNKKQNPRLLCNCIVGCIFNSIRLFVTREIS
jgi:hypothetical protein